MVLFWLQLPSAADEPAPLQPREVGGESGRCWRGATRGPRRLRHPRRAPAVLSWLAASRAAPTGVLTGMAGYGGQCNHDSAAVTLLEVPQRPWVPGVAFYYL